MLDIKLKLWIKTAFNLKVFFDQWYCRPNPEDFSQLYWDGATEAMARIWSNSYQT